MTLTDRQRRELDYHREHARKLSALAEKPVSLDVIRNPKRRPWNAYWSTYDLVLSHDWKGKRILVPGCGAGEDAIRLASLGAEVYAFDLSPELLTIARQRAALHPGIKTDFAGMAAEELIYASQFFDAVFFLDILHHVDIPRAMQEIRRVLKSGAIIIGDELYTHSALQRIRDSRAVRTIYPHMQRWIYGGAPYITEDEHKIDESELAIVLDGLTDIKLRWFNFLSGRLFPQGTILDRLDKLPFGRLLAGRVIFSAVDRDRHLERNRLYAP